MNVLAKWMTEAALFIKIDCLSFFDWAAASLLFAIDDVAFFLLFGALLMLISHSQAITKRVRL